MAGNFNLNDYETVKSRKKRFYDDHEDGRIIVECIQANAETALFKATLYKSSEDQEKNLPASTGYAQEFKGEGGFANKVSWCENCEESAVGRALDNAGYSGNDKCSQEEMKKVERANNGGKQNPKINGQGDASSAPRASSVARPNLKRAKFNG